MPRSVDGTYSTRYPLVSWNFLKSVQESTVDIDATMTALSCQSADFDWIETKTLIDVRKRLWLYDMQEDKIMR